MSDTPNLALPYIEGAQAQKHVTHNEALRGLDALVQLAVLDRDLGAPPTSPAEGARWIVAAEASGAWAGQAANIAAWQDGAWRFYVPRSGWLAYVVDEGALLAFDGAAWVPALDLIGGVSELQNLALLGVGTAADATNPFAAKLNNALWVARTLAEGGDGSLRYKLSKESAGDTLSLLLQTNFSGRAEIGLTGDDDFHFKVSPDGSAWNDALILDRSTGACKILSGFFLAADISPTQITANQNDYDPSGLATASVLRLASDATRTVTGLSGGSDGRVIVLLNVGSNSIVLKNADTGSSAGNRFALGADITLAAEQGALLIYDGTSSRWRCMAVFGAAGGAGFLVAANNLSDLVNAATARSNLGLGSIATFNEGTAAEFRANSAGKALSTDKVWAAADLVTLTDAATIALDLSAGLNFTVTLGGNRTLGNPSNAKAGQCGVIYLVQDSSGGRTLSFGSNYKFAGGAAPTLSTAANAVDRLAYFVRSATHIDIDFSGDRK